MSSHPPNGPGEPGVSQPTSRPVRLAYVVSHPIQYQAPLLRRIAQEPGIDLTVFYGSDFSVKGYRDSGFGVDVKWDIPLLEGYRYEFLPALRDNGTASVFSPISFGFTRRLAGDGGQAGFDVLWVHGYSTVNQMHAILAAKAAGIPVVVRSDSSLGDRPRGSLKLMMKRIFFAGLRGLVDGVLVSGTKNLEYWRYYMGPEFPMFLLPYAVDNDWFQRQSRLAAAGRTALRAELGLGLERPVILFASKLQTRKHCNDLIAAYERLSPGNGVDPEPYLVIVGDGEERQALERQAAATGFKSIRFCGFQNQSELPRYLDLCSVFVLPSRHEPWGLIVNEAMNAGRAVIVTDEVGCQLDLVCDGVEGYVYPARDVTALAEALRRVLASPAVWAAMGERALARIRCWSFEENVTGLREALAKVTGRALGESCRSSDGYAIFRTPEGIRMETARGKSMRILHIIATLDPASGGPSESVRTLMGFGLIGYTGEAVTLDDPNAPFLKGLPFPVHALGPVATTYSFSPKLHGWLRANYKRFDGIVVNGLWNYCGLSAWMVLAGKKPYMVFSHGMLDPYFKHSFHLKHMKKWVYWVLAEYWVLRRAHRVLFTTKEESELARKSFWLHRWNGYIVPYGCSRPNADVEAMTAAFQERMPEMKGKRFMLYLGRIHRKKGCDMLIRSFCKFAALDPELHLVMAGPDQQGWSEELQKIAIAQGVGERVHWPGMVKGDAKWGAFYACEVFILPSHQENFGIAVAEALACGKAVLLADKVNIAPQIQADGSGLMEVDDQDGTDNLVRNWMGMPPEQRRVMEAQALRTFRERYDMQANAATIMRLFETTTQSSLEKTRF